MIFKFLLRLFFAGALLLTSSFSVELNAQDTTRISLLFTGDIMGHDSQIADAYDDSDGKYDYTRCFRFVRPYLESADLTIGNLEVTLAGPPYKGYPQFSSPDELAVALKEVGFDVLVTANNHCVDRGVKGIRRTINVLDSLDIPHTGTFVDEVDRLNNYPLMLQRNGFTIALLNYTYGTNGIPVPSPAIVNGLDTAIISEDVLAAKEKNPDAIIAFVHWGVEYENLPRKNQKDLTAFFFKNGVNLVIGAHPHVLQPMEWNKETNQLVVYSLGNFVSGQRKRYTDGGAMAYVELQKVRYKPDSIVTSIDSAGHFLEWVYRTADAKKEYYILPVTSFEKDSTGFIKDEPSKLAFKTFVEDSRLLYGKNNLYVSEINENPKDTLVTYKVQVAAPEYKDDSLNTVLLNTIDPFFGYEVIVSDNSDPVIMVGPFADQSKAEEVCHRLNEEGRSAQVQKYLNGELVVETPQARDIVPQNIR
ncbi:MAG TPA: CapA family protein [Cyclobacteriaceae bacterium]|nr:CapA family protein [Cyclobacteriaceae bacterium]